MSIPEHLQAYFGPYGPQCFDGNCGEPIGWGYQVISRLGDEKWSEASALGEMWCSYPNWYLLTKRLTHKEAIEKYGKVTDIERGPRGGFRSITFGKKRFITKEMDVNSQMDF